MREAGAVRKEGQPVGEGGLVPGNLKGGEGGGNPVIIDNYPIIKGRLSLLKLNLELLKKELFNVAMMLECN